MQTPTRSRSRVWNQELFEAVVLPMTHKERFDNIGIKPPKGALMYGPPGTGKTLMARACAARTQACFLKLAGPQLVQMFIGDGAKLVRLCCPSTHSATPLTCPPHTHPDSIPSQSRFVTHSLSPSRSSPRSSSLTS